MFRRSRIRSTDSLAGAFLFDVNGIAVSYREAGDEALAWDGNRSRPVRRDCGVDDGVLVDRETFDRPRGLHGRRW